MGNPEYDEFTGNMEATGGFHSSEVADREQYIRENAVALVNRLEEKVLRQSGIIRRLEESASALRANRKLCGEGLVEPIGAAAARIAELEAIIRQHDLCHDLHGKVGVREFADGCANEQRNLYGCAPDADDAARYRWLRDRLTFELGGYASIPGDLASATNSWWFVRSKSLFTTCGPDKPESLDAAIDAARQESQP